LNQKQIGSKNGPGFNYWITIPSSGAGMSTPLAQKLIRGIEYLALPNQYPRHHLLLDRLIFTNRSLVHELPRLTPYRKWLDSLKLATVIDVGAYVGAFSFAMRMILPEIQIYCFDPLEENILSIHKNLGKWGRIKTFQSALGDQKGTIQFNVNDFRASSSILEMDARHRQAFPETSHTTKLDVPIARLDDFLSEMKIKRPLYLKVDVQGFELNVLRGATKILPLVDFLQLEVTFKMLYKKQPLFEDIYDYLHSRGFEFGGLIDSLISPKNGVILQSDALFIRKGSG
jgi:FkbM family methyltransferase